jgi:ATP-dependent helicase/DNAse subunit B
MSIEIYHLPPGCGKFRETLIRRLLDTVKGPDYSGVFHISPTAHIASAWRKSFIRAAGECYIPPQSMTLRQLSKMICSMYSEKNIISKALIPVIISGLENTSPGYSNIIAELIGELKRHYPDELPESIKKILNSTLSALDIPDEVRKRIMNAMDMFVRYNEALTSKGLMDEDDTLHVTARLVMEKRIQPDTLLLDGFYELTPSEELLIRNLISSSDNTIATVPIDINDDLSFCYTNNLKHYFKFDMTMPNTAETRVKIFYHPSPSMEEEISQIAKHIKSGFITGRYVHLDDIYLVFPNPSPYLEMTERIFKRYGIPVNISTYLPLSRSRPYMDLLSLLESVWEEFPRLKFSRFLSSPFFDKIPVSLRESVPASALNAGIVKGKRSWLDAMSEKGVDKELSKVFTILNPLVLCKDNNSLSGFINVLLDILRTLGFVPSGDPEGSLSELRNVLQGVSVIDEILPGKVDLSIFIDTLRRVLNEPRKQEDEPGVRATGLFEVRGIEPNTLYMAGLKDGDLPSRPDIDFMLPDNIRKQLGLVDMKRHLSLQEHIFRRIVQSSGRVFLTYPTMEGDKYFLPSVFLSDAEEIIVKIWGVFSKEEALLKHSGKTFDAHIKEIKGLRHKFKDIGVTDVDQYRSCPRRFYIERILGLEPPEILEFEMDALAIGTLAHDVMERLIKKPFENIDKFTTNASEALDEALPKVPIDAYLKGQFRDAFMQILPEIFKLEESLKSEGFSFHKTEHKLKGELIEGVMLKGKVDRIDLSPGGTAEVIDYKTGTPQFTGSKVLEKGAFLQLFLYAALLKKQGIRPDRVGIYSLKDLKLKWIPGKRDKNTLDDFIDAAIVYGDFRARPLEDHYCRSCAESPYCPYIQTGAREPEAGLNRESRRKGHEEQGL